MYSPRALLTSVFVLSGTASVSADCLSDFNAANGQRSEFARYEVKVSADIVAPDGQVVRRMESSSEFDTTHGLRMKTSGLSTQSDFIIIGEQGWNLTNGVWYDMPSEQLKLALEGVVADRYVFDRDATNFECPGEMEFEGKPYESFVFDQAVATLQTSVTAHFDLVSRLPVATVSNATVNDYKVTITTRFRFDADIRIEAPN